MLYVCTYVHVLILECAVCVFSEAGASNGEGLFSCKPCSGGECNSLQSRLDK